MKRHKDEQPQEIPPSDEEVLIKTEKLLQRYNQTAVMSEELLQRYKDTALLSTRELEKERENTRMMRVEFDIQLDNMKLEYDVIISDLKEKLEATTSNDDALHENFKQMERHIKETEKTVLVEAESRKAAEGRSAYYKKVR
jgi:uncharacterized membrane-anchored protein YhcB (DUF1043 family)